jgi:hypothetical protein
MTPALTITGRGHARLVPAATLARKHVKAPNPRSSRSPRQSGGDLVEYRRNDEFSVHRPQMRIAGGEFRDEFCPGHRRLRVNRRALHTVLTGPRNQRHAASSPQIVIYGHDQEPMLASARPNGGLHGRAFTAAAVHCNADTS